MPSTWTEVDDDVLFGLKRWDLNDDFSHDRSPMVN